MSLYVPQMYPTSHSAGDAGGQNPLSSTSYYFGRWSIFDPDTSYATHRTEVMHSQTLVAAQIMVIVAGLSGNPASNVTFSLRVNDATDFTIGTMVFSNPGASIETSSLSIPLAVGDDFVIKFATPNWSSQTATVVFYSATLWWRRT